MMVTWSPSQTWYFTKGFEKKITSNLETKLILDSANISENAIKLVRNKKDSLYCYWVDVDTLYYYDNEPRIYTTVKIVSRQGKILRFLGGWLEPEITDKIDLLNYKIEENKKGNIEFILNENRFFLTHLGDEMGLYHMDIIRPNNVSSNASLSMIFEGYSYIYSWIEYDRQKEDCFILKKFNYQGDLLDTIYATMPKEWTNELNKNYYFKYKYNSLELINSGIKYKLKIIDNPF